MTKSKGYRYEQKSSKLFFRAGIIPEPMVLLLTTTPLPVIQNVTDAVR
jgi:hypothetical protein